MLKHQMERKIILINSLKQHVLWTVCLRLIPAPLMHGVLCQQGSVCIVVWSPSFQITNVIAADRETHRAFYHTHTLRIESNKRCLETESRGAWRRLVCAARLLD